MYSYWYINMYMFFCFCLRGFAHVMSEWSESCKLNSERAKTNTARSSLLENHDTSKGWEGSDQEGPGTGKGNNPRQQATPPPAADRILPILLLQSEHWWRMVGS